MISKKHLQSDLTYRVDILDFNAISESFRKVIEKKYKILSKQICAMQKV